MIPLQLSVRNFLCYRDNLAPLDLRGVHVACLCGANGHGKSALLDAMTWCLWGQARTGSRNHDALIAYGETECRVELDFQTQGQTYRAIRRRRSSGSGRTEVDLFALNDAGEARPITGNTVRDTNARIQRLVGMDYNTFVNSAFLLQGRADEFTRKTPAERKEALSAILGLNLYEALQAAARDGRDRHRDAANQHTGALKQRQEDLAAIPDPAAELAEIAARRVDLDAKLETAVGVADRLRAETAQLRRKQAELDAGRQRIGDLERDIAQADAAAEAARQRIAASQSLAERADEIAAGMAQLDAAREELARLEAARREYDRLQGEKTRLQRAVARAEAQLEADIKGIRRRIREELEPAAGRVDAIAGALDRLAADEQDLLAEQDAMQARSEAAAELQREIAVDQAELARCVADGKELRARQVEMQSVDAACPLCLTPLSADACGNIREHYEAEIRAKLHQHHALQQNISELTAERQELAADVERRRSSLTARQRQAQRERGRLDGERRQSVAAGQELATLRPRLAAAQDALASGRYAAAEWAELAEVDGAIATLAYDDTARQRVFARAQSRQHWEAERAALEAAQANLPGDEAQLQRALEQAGRWRGEAAAAERQLAADQAAVANLPAVERQAAAAETAAAKLRAERDSVMERNALLQAAAARRRDLIEDIARLTELREEAQKELAIYADLFTAFGRSGVPAMLIDTAVPHIENEANHLLGRMTDNRLAVKLETQRVTQGGNVAETLDIFISDELGTRSYDLFSGGEAFRINLSLRIALAKVLSQRLGVPLPTLFIDEGFGTQDAAGRERVVDAIASIQNEFEKIIVITHLDELKDLFPVRIEVLKTDAGSQFWLS